MIDIVERFHSAIDFLHRHLTDTERRYFTDEANRALRAAREAGQKASRVRWSYHPQPKVRRSA